ncbi:MAG: hypothetical protein Q9220_003125 [cf. Caloplaca sp. 1 TL-2023]
MFLSVGDVLQLSKLAADLYTKGWVVARDAPQEFRDLVHELSLLKDILFIVHRKVNREADSYGEPTKRVLQRCLQTLSEFSELVAKYEKLALSDRGHWFRRLQWSREQDSIRSCRNKLQKHQQLLQLVLTPEGRTILSEDRNNDTQQDVGIQWSETFPLPYGSEPAFPRRLGSSSLSQPSRTKTIDSAQTLIPSYSTPPLTSADYSPSIRQRHRNAYLSSDYNELPPIQKSPSQITGRSSLSDSSRSAENNYPSQIFPKRASDASVDGRLRQASLGTIGSEDTQWRPPSDQTIFQPLEIAENREKHECPEQLKQAFLESFESVDDEILDETWIRVATWWLLKSQNVLRMAAVSTDDARKSLYRDYSHWENTTSKDQAYVDLLKSSWIVDVLIRERKIAGELTKSQPRKLVIDLLKALKSDLHHRRHERSCGKIPDTATLLKQDLSLLESFEQTVEAKENEPRAMDDLTTSQRWITIDKDHGGFQNEKILFRSFVNAQIGQRNERSKSSNAPYVILLWTKSGESEISVSLCNHRDTLNLSRKLTSEDIEDWRSLEADTTALHLEFPSQPAEVNFLTTTDFKSFREGPQKFFDAVRGRDPRSGELTIFQTVLKSYRNVNASRGSESSESDAAQRSFGSCELRVYEQMDETCWKTIRRIVVSSAADSKKWGSASYWLPISNVRLQVEDCTITVSWSDCGHLEKKSGGNYNPYYSYVYRPDEANQKIILLFESSEDAQRFEDCILYLTETPPQVRLTSRIDCPSAFQETRVYSLFDQDDPDRGYHGIVYAKKSPKTYHYSQICYVYRDLDFSIQNQNPAEIELHNIRVPHYISTRHKMLAKPREQDALPEFREVTWISRSLQLVFSCDDDAVRFFGGLTGWRLKFYRQCGKLILTDTGHFRKSKKSYKGAEIYLWEKAAPEDGLWTQLVVRLLDGDEPWLTARRKQTFTNDAYTTKTNVSQVAASGGGLGMPTGGVAELKGLAIQQGKDLDTKHMKANPKEESNSKPCWKFTVMFKEAGGG